MRGVGRMKSPYTDSLSHTTWECKYNIVFVPKFRRKEIYRALKQDIGIILRELCRRKEVEIINAEACQDHVHMYASIPPKMSISSAVYNYVANQLKEDMLSDQMTIKEYKAPFKGQ